MSKKDARDATLLRLRRMVKTGASKYIFVKIV